MESCIEMIMNYLEMIIKTNKAGNFYNYLFLAVIFV